LEENKGTKLSKNQEALQQLDLYNDNASNWYSYTLEGCQEREKNFRKLKTDSDNFMFLQFMNGCGPVNY
jgi:hypothetical protein